MNYFDLTQEQKAYYEKLRTAQRATYLQFLGYLTELGIDGSKLRIRGGDKCQHDFLLDGELIGWYNYHTGVFYSPEGHKYHWPKEKLTYPDGSSEHVFDFPEALKIMLEIED